jgi:hypothetical protein
MVPGGGQPTVAARQVAGVSGHADDAPALAWLDGGEALDLCATAWSSADRQGASSADRSLSAGESAVGLSAHCGRAERPRHADRRTPPPCAQTPDQQTEDEPLLPDDLCANETERHKWRADVLAFIRDHVALAEVYRLAEADLAFAELLPEKPGWLEQDEYEERNRVGFQLERLTKRVGMLMPSGSALANVSEQG